MYKYYTKKQIEINGQSYNSGDIIISRNLLTNNFLIPLGYYSDTIQPSFSKVKPVIWQKNAPIELSVIITAHNSMEFFNRNIESWLIQQTNHKFEIIVVIDKAQNPQEYITLLEKKKKKYPDKIIKYFVVNFGHACLSRNFGFTKVSKQSKYIQHWDEDDYVYPNYVEENIKALEQNHKIGFVYSRFDFDIKMRHRIRTNEYEWSKSWNKYEGIINGTKMIRKKYWQKWDKNLVCYQDYDNLLSVIEKNVKGMAIRKNLFKYVLNPKSLWGKGINREERIKCREYITKKHNLPKIKWDKHYISVLDDTFVIMISRLYPIKQCLDAIDKAIIPRKNLHLFIFLDTDEEKLIKVCKTWQRKQDKKWLSTRMFISNKKPIKPDKFGSYQLRWERIIENMNIIRRATFYSKIVFMVEDDTVIPKDAFIKLYERIKKDKKIGCIQGVEASRRVKNGPCGAWIMDVKQGRVKTKIGLKAKKSGIEQIDGGGYYCWAFRQEAIQQINFRSSLNGWCGPDLWTWYDIKQSGWKTLIDWSIWCKHIDEDGKIYTPDKTRNWLFDFRKDDLHPKMNFDYEM